MFPYFTLGEMVMLEEILAQVKAERDRQKVLTFQGESGAVFDTQNSQGDWVSYITAYAGRASQKVARNQREGQGFRENMLKVAAIAVAAIEAHDLGYAIP